MTKKVLQEAIDKIKWFHSMPLPYADILPEVDAGFLTTPGVVDHCTDKIATERFGIPQNLTHSTVLDIGAWDGYFTFLAERRGAVVTAIDPAQDCSGITHLHNGFHTASAAWGSRSPLFAHSLIEHRNHVQRVKKSKYDVCFYFGVLYHVENPIEELRALYDLTNHFALIETACLPQQIFYPSRQVWQYLPGHNGDPTNKWYGSPEAIIAALKDVGFQRVERIYRSSDRTRITLKALNL